MEHDRSELLEEAAEARRRPDTAVGGAVGTVLGLQRSAGNAAAGLAVQRGLGSLVRKLRGNTAEHAEKSAHAGGEFGWTEEQAAIVAARQIGSVEEATRRAIIASWAKATGSSKVTRLLGEIDVETKKGNVASANEARTAALAAFGGSVRGWIDKQRGADRAPADAASMAQQHAAAGGIDAAEQDDPYQTSAETPEQVYQR